MNNMDISLKNILYGLTHIGTRHTLEDPRSNQLVNFNTLLIYSAFILFLSLSTNLIQKSWTQYDNVIYLGAYFTIVLCLILNGLGKFNTSTLISHLGFCAVFCLGAIVNGDVFICCIINMVWMVISFRFLETATESIVVCAVQLLAVITTIFLVMHIDYDHQINQYDPTVRSIVYSLMFFYLFTMAKRLTDQIRYNYNKNNKLVIELEQKNKQIELAYHEMENFAHKISHDLKAPLRNMNTYATLLKRDIQKKKVENIEEYSNHIYSNGLKLTKMIDDVLAYSKLNARETETQERIQLSEIIEPIQKNMKQIYPNSEVKVKTNGHIISSRTKLTMLFQNLIENGLKYNKSTTKKVSVDFSNGQNQYTIHVKDNGIGIPLEYQDQIFNLFSRLHSNDEYEGTGIGLSTCKKIVEEHLNGNIIVKSAPDQGTTFKIIIPQTQL